MRSIGIGALIFFLTGGLIYSLVHQIITMQMTLMMSAAILVSVIFLNRSRYVCNININGTRKIAGGSPRTLKNPNIYGWLSNRKICQLNTHIDEFPRSVVAFNLNAEDTLDLATEDVYGAARGEATCHRLWQVNGDEAQSGDAQQKLKRTNQYAAKYGVIFCCLRQISWGSLTYLCSYRI